MAEIIQPSLQFDVSKYRYTKNKHYSRKCINLCTDDDIFYNNTTCGNSLCQILHLDDWSILALFSITIIVGCFALAFFSVRVR